MKYLQNQSAIAILSGGIDSTVALYNAIEDGYHIECAISFDYGQKNFKKIECAKETCRKLGISHRIIDLTSLAPYLKSALTSEDQEVPEGHYQEESMKQTVVPNRNMIFASIAAGIAISLNAETIILGVHQGDHAIYPDCRPRFIKRMNKALAIADWSFPVKIHAPLLKMSKIDIVELGYYHLNVDFSNTWNCYKGGEFACGKCGSCQERREAFAENSVIDPISYEDDVNLSDIRTENP